MFEQKRNKLLLLKFNNLDNESGIEHFITTKFGGSSIAQFSSLNLSFKVGDRKNIVASNRSILAKTLEIPEEKILFPDQCHTNHIKVVEAGTSLQDLPETDALITQTTGLCLCVLTADCVPVLLFDPKEKVVAAIHAGWRGTVGRIVPRTIERMVKSFSSRPENIVAAIGPSISQRNYEVGNEVAEKFHVFFHDKPSIIKKKKEGGKYHIDLKEANKELLLRNGVKDKNLEISEKCTFDMPDLFFSARRDGLQSGRFATGIMLL